MEQDIRLNINMGMSLENIIEEMLMNMEAYNYEQSEEEEFKEMIKNMYHQEFSKLELIDRYRVGEQNE